ncbi:MAG: transcription-repair coupling factor, partial [Clostridia bacterium]|nr:transcription-repair coupling factor [Clostridia bacterium]
GRPLALISPAAVAAQKQAQDLSRLFGEGYAFLPPRELLFSRAAASRESTWQRLAALSELREPRNSLKVLCLPVEALMDRCLPPEAFEAASLRLAEGAEHPPDRLLRRLLSAGYERVDIVEGPGQCAARGSILDVFSPNRPDALRIEFFDNVIDSMRPFDCVSQRSTGRVRNAVLAPASECVIGEPGEASADPSSDVAEGACGACAGEPPISPWEAAARRVESAFRETPGAEAGPASPLSLREEYSPDELPPLEAFLAQLDALEEPDAPPPAAGADSSPGAGDGKTASAGLADRVRSGRPPRNGAMWMHILLPRTASLLSYLDDPILLCCQPEQYPARVNAREEAFRADLADALRRGDGMPAQDRLLMDYAELLASFQNRPAVALTERQPQLRPGQLVMEEALSFETRPVMPYQSRMEALRADIVHWTAQGVGVVLLAGGENRGRRLRQALAELGVEAAYQQAAPAPAGSGPPVPLAPEGACPPDQETEVLWGGIPLILPFSYTKGFIHPAVKLVLISDEDIFGEAYQRARKRGGAGERLSSFTDLSPGDFVVHDFHGVGQYAGIVQVPGDDVKRDYLLIRYADNDKLYVPTDQFDRVQKFIGGANGSGAPKLNRLGGAEWGRQRNRVKAGLKELAFDLAELYAKRTRDAGHAFGRDTPWQREFEDGFPYELTPDQLQSVADIRADMERPRNMDRLLCGDVGYGKTEVALRAAFKAVVDGKQAAILAPTTILVQQHFHTIRKRFGAFPVNVEMISRFRTAAEQRDILARLKAGKIDLLVGTHRLLGKDVEFADLGLLIVDEEHRFGVRHKESIQRLKNRVDVLSLTATPIPRTLHMSLAGIRDMSLLETPPEERLPVKTYVLEYDDELMAEAIRRELRRGGQVYFLYNRVRSIERMHARLTALTPEARIGVAHGQMRENALEDVMLDFYAGAFDVLLCTTIIESGLDVPSANTLIVFDADRFGLSQLYQIRGRVGRSSRQAYAYFTTRAQKVLGEAAAKRLTALREFTEFGAGYRIALRDLEIRGAGDVLGPQQHGHLAAVGYDMYLKLLEQAVGEAQGHIPQPELDTRIELAVDAYLPDGYISKELLRVEVYKRIAMIREGGDRADIEDELTDRFGDIPPPVQNLVSIAHLRAVTRRLGGSHLFLRPDGVHLLLDEGFMKPAEALLPAMQRADPRLGFGVRRGAELVLKEKGLSALEALEAAVRVFEKLAEEAERTPGQNGSVPQ